MKTITPAPTPTAFFLLANDLRMAAGDSDEGMQSRFLYRFGTDVMSAQGLSERAALELRDAIMEAIK